MYMGWEILQEQEATDGLELHVREGHITFVCVG